MVVLGGAAVSYERGTPVACGSCRQRLGGTGLTRPKGGLTPNTVELIPTLGALFPEAGPSRTRSSQPTGRDGPRVMHTIRATLMMSLHEPGTWRGLGPGDKAVRGLLAQLRAEMIGV